MFLVLLGGLLRSALDEFWSAFCRGVSVENLRPRGFPATCFACCSVSFPWGIARDSPIVKNCFTDDEKTPTQNESAPWSSAAKYMFPGNSSMT